MNSVYKSIVNDTSIRKKQTKIEIKRIHSCLLNMLSEIEEVCEKNDIKPFLVYGNLLGKVRHNGFIPWDDDLDIGMIREDYDKFVEIFGKHLSDRYVISTPNGRNKAFYRFVQIGRLGTSRVSSIYSDKTSDQDNPTSHCFIDIFPFDYAPNNKFLRLLKGFFCEVLMMISGCADFDVKRLNADVIRLFKRSIKGRFEFYFRILLHNLLAFQTTNGWYHTVDKAIRGKKSDYVVCALGKDYYRGAVYKKNDLLPLVKSDYYGIPIYIPQNSHNILSQCYGNYMELPPESKRECHSADSIIIEDNLFIKKGRIIENESTDS